MVHLLHANTLSFDQERLPDAQILRGNVIFRHDSATMYCDSAYFFDRTNSLYAFSHVRMVQGDTLKGFGDAMYYDGNAKIARFRHHVRLIHCQTILNTDSLNYDRTRNLAYYFGGGTIEDSINTLTSEWGQYHPSTYQALFKTNVHLTNDHFTLQSDTLCYNTNSHLADLVSPTVIEYEQESTIYTSLGTYNTETEQSQLYNRSVVHHQKGKQITGDTIFYDKLHRYGRILGNMSLIDSTDHITLYGQYGEYYEDGNRGMATDSALLVDWEDEDYAYIHADSLFTADIPNPKIDSTAPDSVYPLIRAFYQVRVYRTDLQAVCDSLIYNDRDSTMTLIGTPLCWNEGNQLSADIIHLYMVNNAIDHLHGTGAALVVKQETLDYFDQMSGKEIEGFIENDKLKQVRVSGNAETIFYPLDSATHDFIGMNRTQSSYIQVFLKNDEVDHVLFTTASSGSMYPLDQVPAGQDRLSAFFWAEAERPLQPGDVFLHPARTSRPKGAPISATQKEDDKEQPKGNTTRKKNH